MNGGSSANKHFWEPGFDAHRLHPLVHGVVGEGGGEGGHLVRYLPQVFFSFKKILTKNQIRVERDVYLSHSYSHIDQLFPAAAFFLVTKN